MSEKIKHPAARARAVAEHIVKALKPVCARIEIAGSLRRQKYEVGDIEILYIPKNTQVPDRSDLFKDKTVTVNAADIIINELIARGSLAKRLNKDGHETWGQWNKLAKAVKTGIPVDLFATTQEHWWVSLVMRTGSKETNIRLSSGAMSCNRRFHAYGHDNDGITDTFGNPVAVTSEREVFELCCVPYLEPHQR